MGPTAFDGNLGLDVLFNNVFKHVQKHKAARLFAYMLQSCEKVNWSVGVFFFKAPYYHFLLCRGYTSISSQTVPLACCLTYFLD